MCLPSTWAVFDNTIERYDTRACELTHIMADIYNRLLVVWWFVSRWSFTIISLNIRFTICWCVFVYPRHLYNIVVSCIWFRLRCERVYSVLLWYNHTRANQPYTALHCIAFTFSLSMWVDNLITQFISYLSCGVFRFFDFTLGVRVLCIRLQTWDVCVCRVSPSGCVHQTCLAHTKPQYESRQLFCLFS